MIVKPADILSWLDDVPCVLMIDELHRLDGLQSNDGLSFDQECTTASLVIEFLKLNFLMQKHRYFVFSSNVASTVNCVDMYMNYRGIIVRELPLIPHIKDFRRIFEWQDLTINEAIYFGLIPSMLLLKRRGHLSTLGRDSVLTYIKKDADDRMVKAFCKSFIDGYHERFPPSLLQFMNTGNREVVRWIPYHMVPILSDLSEGDKVRKYSSLLVSITKLFDSFLNSKQESGEVWEKLFVITLIIRAIASDFDRVILPLDKYIYQNDCFVSYHEQV
jgi:hypothetical protein